MLAETTIKQTRDFYPSKGYELYRNICLEPFGTKSQYLFPNEKAVLAGCFFSSSNINLLTKKVLIYLSCYLFRKTKSIKLFLILITLAHFSLQAQSLDSLISEAVANNPQLKALRYRVKASEFRAESVNNYPAPNVSLEFSQVPINEINLLNQSISNNFAVSQMFPLGDKIRAMTEVERRNVKIEGDNAAIFKINLIGQVKMSYYTLWLIERKIDIQKKSILFLEDLIKSMELTFSINRINQADILTIKSEIASAETQLFILGKQQESENYRMNKLLGRKLEDKGIANIDEFSTMEFSITQSKLEELLSEANPTLKKMGDMIEMNKAMIAANNRELIPDLMVQAMLMRMPRGMILTAKSDLTMLEPKTEVMYSLMFSVNLPFAPWSINKYTAKSEELAAGISSLEYEKEEMQREMSAKIKEAAVKYRTSAELLKLYEEKVLPLYRQASEAQVSAYHNNKTAITSVIDSYRMLLMQQMNYYMAKADTRIALAEIEMMVNG